MMKKVQIILFTFLLALGACNDAKNDLPNDPLDYFGEPVALNKPQVLVLDELEAMDPIKILKSDSALFVLNMQADEMLSRIDLNNHRVNHLVERGGAPNEAMMLFALKQDRDNCISTIDPNTGRLFEFDIKQSAMPSDSLARITKLPHPGNTLSVLKTDSFVIATGTYPEGRYLSYNLNDKSETFFMNYPLPAELSKISDIYKSIIYASNETRLKPDGKLFVCAHILSGVFEICGINQGKVSTLKALHFYYPDVAIKDKGNAPIQFSKDNKYGFCDLAVTDQYIYALYSGKSYRNNPDDFTRADNLLVFDWDGNAVKSYKLKTPLSCISFDSKENAIYGIGYQPEVTLIKYDLNN